ncbi:hypothetical protein [Methanospirillum lacunae]|uniref:Uncharacterized protein n=1 Tax=Methanospirillum lacunae TaxID=668570 RepID=A0A2V2N081_9EURY|nr:hypothetical protein [Methanospirillum lacunae]PWR71975.1 hypothetical protein DK846_08240 [Methanospirillum lacunae]
MAKKIRLKTISLGSEPDQPDMDELTCFIRSMKGQEADLTTYYLIRSLEKQLEAGITSPACGGRFMQSRFEDALICSPEGCHVSTSVFEDDARVMIKTAGPVASVLPSPGLLPESPDPEDEEAFAEFCDVYAKILRNMRDQKITGHILHAKEVSMIEAEHLSSRKTIFVIPDGTFVAQSGLLEFQSTIALSRTRVKFLDELIDQFDIRRLILVDPNEEGFKKALQHLDPEKIQVGGYGKGEDRQYWKCIADSAEIPLPNN